MAKNMKTIKFGENGEVYNVNGWGVERSGELSEAGTNIDFGGTFENGLTEINAVLRGVDAGAGDYFFITINGQQSGFIAADYIYKTGINIKLKKVGNLWDANVYGAYGTHGNAYAYVLNLLSGVSAITDFSIQAYSESTPFAVGTKYALEGR